MNCSTVRSKVIASPKQFNHQTKGFDQARRLKISGNTPQILRNMWLKFQLSTTLQKGKI